MEPSYVARMGYARRQAVRYTPAENFAILLQHAQGFDLEEIAEYHERTVGGMSLQIERLLRTLKGLKNVKDRWIRQAAYRALE